MFDVDGIKRRLAEVEGRFATERERLRLAKEAISGKKERVQLALTFLEPDVLENPQAKEYLRKAKQHQIKLLTADKEAILYLELEPLIVEYDMAEFNCKTSKEHVEQLKPMLNFIQSEMKLQ